MADPSAPQPQGLRVVLGAGESGSGAALLARQHGYPVFVSDQRPIREEIKAELGAAGARYEEGGHNLEALLRAEEAIKSPGIPNHAPVVRALMEAGIPVISELEFAARYTQAHIVGITGTNGKTTTALLTHHILQRAGLDVLLAGNIGNSLSRELLVRDYEYIVLEVSSFQLDNIQSFRSHISVLLNITPDHLNHYQGSFSQYVEAKFRLCANQTTDDWLVFNYDDPVIRARLLDEESGPQCQAKRLPFSALQELGVGASFVNETMTIYMGEQNKGDKDKLKLDEKDVPLKGRHNRYNTMAASVVSKVLNVRKQVIRESLQDFQNMEHRLEHFVRVNGVDFINDSKATNVNAAWYALESMSEHVIWICGGQDKGNDYSPLIPLVNEKVKAIICLGKDNRKIRNALRETGKTPMETDNLRKAVEHAFQLAESGDTVLYSPACASFDLFKNYEDRGNQFKEMVQNISQESKS
jgi:UDP-N-acetylmuramoylalanine--D-glutamate ligase